jgi:hypothetical protein
MMTITDLADRLRRILAGERFQTPTVAARRVVAPRLPGTSASRRDLAGTTAES